MERLDRERNEAIKAYNSLNEAMSRELPVHQHERDGWRERAIAAEKQVESLKGTLSLLRSACDELERRATELDTAFEILHYPGHGEASVWLFTFAKLFRTAIEGR